MTRETQTTIIVFGMIMLAALGFWMFQQSQDAEAVARGDYAACWTDGCKSAVADAAAERLGGKEESLSVDRPTDEELNASLNAVR